MTRGPRGAELGPRVTDSLRKATRSWWVFEVNTCNLRLRNTNWTMEPQRLPELGRVGRNTSCLELQDDSKHGSFVVFLSKTSVFLSVLKVIRPSEVLLEVWRTEAGFAYDTTGGVSPCHRQPIGTHRFSDLRRMFRRKARLELSKLAVTSR